jgi:ferredoxin
MTFLDRDGDKKTVSAKQGDSLLDVAKNNDIDLEGVLFN